MPKITPLSRLTKRRLQELYQKQELSQAEVARRLGVTQGAIWLKMKLWGIEARTREDGIRMDRLKGNWSGEKNPRWNGGRHKSAAGYVFVRNKGSKASYKGYIREHVLVWERANGPLPDGWHVHHKNGIKDDNRIENLEAMPWKKHRELIPELLSRISKLETQNEALKKALAETNCSVAESANRKNGRRKGKDRVDEKDSVSRRNR